MVSECGSIMLYQVQEKDDLRLLGIGAFLVLPGTVPSIHYLSPVHHGAHTQQWHHSHIYLEFPVAVVGLWECMKETT